MLVDRVFQSLVVLLIRELNTFRSYLGILGVYHSGTHTELSGVSHW